MLNRPTRPSSILPTPIRPPPTRAHPTPSYASYPAPSLAQYQVTLQRMKILTKRVPLHCLQVTMPFLEHVLQSVRPLPSHGRHLPNQERAASTHRETGRHTGKPLATLGTPNHLRHDGAAQPPSVSPFFRSDFLTALSPC